MISSRPPPGPSTAPLQKRRRVSLACTSCRQRKARCNGHRPSCSPCLELGIPCAYEVPFTDAHVPKSRQSAVHHTDDEERVQLRRKVMELEAELRSASARPRITASNQGIQTQTSSLQPIARGHQHKSGTTEDAAITSALPDANTGQANGEVQVDMLAAVTFDGVSVAGRTDRNIGYFGPTSNHALFRTIADTFVTVVQVFSVASSPQAFQESAHVPPSLSSTLHGEASNVTSHPVDIDFLPNRQDVTLLINQFSSTVGIVLPFINTSNLLQEYDREAQESERHFSRPMRALLSIICAYACYTIGGAETEVYYRRAVAVLDEQTLRGSSLTLVQALLLIGSFEQNNQRSVTSWTFHAVAVKAAFQLGLHSPMHYKDYRPEDSELRRRVWYALVNQDRYLSISLGRPCMIPQQHIQVHVPDGLSLPFQPFPPAKPDHNSSLIYFNHIILLDTVKSSVIDSLYGYNIESEQLPIHELIIRRLQVSWKLEQWRQNMSSFYKILTEADLSHWSAASYATSRLQALLSIQYYGIILLANRPVLTRFLSEWLKVPQRGETDDAILEDNIIMVLKNDLETAKSLSGVIGGIIEYGESFLECNAAWWHCNYSMFTVNLHLFAILLVIKCRRPTLAARGISIAEVRNALDHSLTLLRSFERLSLMSRKAGQCMLEFLRAFDSLSSEQRVSQPTFDTTWTIPEDVNAMSQNAFSQRISQSANAFLLDCSDGAFLDEHLHFPWDGN